MWGMATQDLVLVCWQLALGFSLAATTGLRAFLPLFAAAAAARAGMVQLGPSFAWLASDAALIVFGSAVVFELLGDKIPVLDHALDAGGIVVKPAAATLLTASMFTSMDPVMATVLGLVAGGATAGGVHLVKAKARVASTAFTAGVANPVLSLIEDLVAVIGVVLAILIPVVVAITIVIFLGLATFLLIRRFQRMPTAQPA